MTRRAGLDAPGLYTSAVWFDFNNDGRPDLFVGSFVRYSKELEKECKTAGVHHYCYPASYDASPSKLYRNNGDGTFTDVSVPSGIAKHPGKTFGAVAVDVDGDGYMDLFVSNDSVPNFLFHNLRDGRFEEIGLEASVAYSDDGVARSGMGVDSGDYDGDGRMDLFVANLNRERFSIYRNVGNLAFQDMAGPSNVGQETYMYSGWGLRFVVALASGRWWPARGCPQPAARPSRCSGSRCSGTGCRPAPRGSRPRSASPCAAGARTP